jgi:hypothetical protein
MLDVIAGGALGRGDPVLPAGGQVVHVNAEEI